MEHITYNFDMKFCESNIDRIISDSIKRNYTNILFFGNIIESKGVIELIRLIENVELSSFGINIIIAGKDSRNIINNNYFRIHDKCVCITRYINDDEMKFLYTNCDFIILPYKEISQSGVLETAVKFNKPTITSKNNYFTEFFDKYPSFGHCIDTSNTIIFAESILKICRTKSNNYFKNEELNLFNKNKNISFDNFISKLTNTYNE